MSVVTLVKYYQQPEASKPLVTFLTQIQQGTYADKVERLRDMYKRGLETQFDEQKRRIPWFCISANFKVADGQRKLITYSGHVVLEMPYLNDRDKRSVKELLIQNENVLAFFDSALGLGLCVVVKVATGPEEHELTFERVRKYFVRLTGVQRISELGKDLFHTVQLSFDEEMYLNVEAKAF